jgi:hypothetical protein
MYASAFEKGHQPLNKYLLSGPNFKPVIAFKENSPYNKIHWPISKIKKVYSDSRGTRFLDVCYSLEGREKILARHPTEHFLHYSKCLS